MINIGEVNLLKTIIQLEQRVATLEKAIVALNSKNASTPGFNPLTQDEFNNYKRVAGEALIKKYPSLGLKFEGE